MARRGKLFRSGNFRGSPEGFNAELRLGAERAAIGAVGRFISEYDEGLGLVEIDATNPSTIGAQMCERDCGPRIAFKALIDLERRDLAARGGFAFQTLPERPLVFLARDIDDLSLKDEIRAVELCLSRLEWHARTGERVRCCEHKPKTDSECI